MNQTQTTKICPTCAQVINAPAKLCPYCRSLQGSWAFLNWQNPTVTLLVAVMAVGTALALPLMLGKRLTDEGENYAVHRDTLQVIESSFHLRDGQNGLELAVVGILTNTSSLSWKDVQVEAQLFDSGGRLIDTVTDRRFEQAILPHDVMSFRLLNKAARERAEYASHKLSIRFAREARKSW